MPSQNVIPQRDQRMNDLIAIYRLSSDEVERFDATYRGDSCMKSSLDDSAVHWRASIKAEHSTMEACRWGFLRSIVGYDEREPMPTMEKLPSMARYLCMRVEQQVIAQEASL